jgi:hypothetical protein
VILDKPHCAYVPHTFILYPSYYDAKSEEFVKTGQKFIVKNSAKVVHDTNFTGDPFENPAQKHQLPPGQSKSVELKPQDQPINFTCNVHKFMRAYAFVLDHPYGSVSKGFPVLGKDGKAVPLPESDWGKFEIQNVPAGVPVRVVLWHEGKYVSQDGFAGEKGKSMTFEDGKTMDLKIKIKK